MLILLLLICVGCSKDQEGVITASGVIEAIEVNVASQIAGQIEAVHYEEGQAIAKEQLLVELDCIDYELQEMQAKTNLDMLKAQFELTVKGARSEDIKQAIENKTQAEANYTNAKLNYDRVKNLYKTNVVAKKMLDDATNQLEVTEAQFKQSQEALQKIKKLSREEEITMAQARMENAEWFLKSMKERVKDCKITSPIDGYALKKVFEPGEYVMPGSTVTVVSDLKKIRVVVYIPEAEVFRVKYGQEVQVKVDGYKDKAFTGVVTFISEEAEFTPKNIQTKDERVKLMFAIKIMVDNPELKLKPGLPADVEFK
ncbi:MAG: hypothetical protein A2Y62_09605 [Candidatus Fischerbacteria bacterium RBG_13_37_8]|uniref:Uncharacterized protein n=1 Tax=Candidatus Fischerbacteria bacterium RBG_13_37_8 TaxID=1817863 RepID=A0A1F5V6E0_9BACT|nr:MAG: hypothetical protein A2Y62_09605 [Candidatus Fischerbacteria bacterium RBG_13_37_8]